MFVPGDFFEKAALPANRSHGNGHGDDCSHDVVRTKAEMMRTLHEQHDFSDRFIAHMLARNIRVEEDLVDQLFNSSEKRLARTLLLLARYGKEDTTVRTVPRLSQETFWRK